MLVYAENEKKVVTVSAGATVITGSVLRVNPLILVPTDGSAVTVLDFDSIQSVAVHDASGDEVVKACKPERETKFMGTRRM